MLRSLDFFHALITCHTELTRALKGQIKVTPLFFGVNNMETQKASLDAREAEPQECRPEGFSTLLQLGPLPVYVEMNDGQV